MTTGADADAAILWRKPPVLALTAPGSAVGRVGEPAIASAAALAAAGAMLHDAPLPPSRASLDEKASTVDSECDFDGALPSSPLLVANDVLPEDASLFAGERIAGISVGASLATA